MFKQMAKVATYYQEHTVSNRKPEEKVLTFSSLSPMDASDVLNKMASDANELKMYPFEKRANVGSSTFDAFGQTKHYISSKLGIDSEVAHDLASSVLQRAQDLQNVYGGDLQTMVTGIVDKMEPADVQARVGAVPTKGPSPQNIEDGIRDRLMNEAGMDSYRIDFYCKMILQQARNLLVMNRPHDLRAVANAVFDVLLEHQDFSLVKDMSSSDRMKKEVEAHLTNVGG